MNPLTLIGDLINVPLGYLMKFLYGIFNNYAIAIFFFALAMKIVLLPFGIQQQKSQMKMAKIRPKEQAIRGKYAGRTDSATQQKMQTEVMDMYKKENYSPMGGCLPLLIQMPILFALYNIIRNPLTYIAQFSGDVVNAIKLYIFENKDMYIEAVSGLAKMTKFENIQQIDIIKIFNNSAWFESIKANVAEIPAGFVNLNFGILTSTPAEMGLSLLLLIPLLNFAASFFQMRVQKIINANTAAADVANNKSMKIMEYTMPLLIVYMSYSMYAALGLYWIFQAVLGIVQMFILAKIMPIPKPSEEEYELAQREYGTAKKKKKKKPESEIVETEFAEESEESDETDESDKNDGDEKYISKTIPKGINPNVKNNYQKTGKKYKIKKKK